MQLHSATIFAILAISCLSMNQFSSEVAVNYGSVVRIINPSNGYMYYRYNIEYIPMIYSLEEEE